MGGQNIMMGRQALYWQAGMQISDMVHCWLFGCKDDVGRPFTFRVDRIGRRQENEACSY
jgi:hypothetical protein